MKHLKEWKDYSIEINTGENHDSGDRAII